MNRIRCRIADSETNNYKIIAMNVNEIFVTWQCIAPNEAYCGLEIGMYGNDISYPISKFNALTNGFQNKIIRTLFVAY